MSRRKLSRSFIPNLKFSPDSLDILSRRINIMRPSTFLGQQSREKFRGVPSLSNISSPFPIFPFHHLACNLQYIEKCAPCRDTSPGKHSRGWSSPAALVLVLFRASTTLCYYPFYSIRDSPLFVLSLSPGISIFHNYCPRTVAACAVYREHCSTKVTPLSARPVFPS